jgi:hypothetical protein
MVNRTLNVLVASALIGLSGCGSIPEPAKVEGPKIVCYKLDSGVVTVDPANITPSTPEELARLKAQGYEYAPPKARHQYQVKEICVRE